MRWFASLVLALGVMGCSETAGTGGSAGVGGGGVGGDGGSGGVVEPKFPCTEQGIRDAIAEGDGPHRFDCDGPTTVVTEAEIVIDKDVVLDGEGNLAVDGGGAHRVFSVGNLISAELRGIRVQGGVSDEGGGISVRDGHLTLVDCVVRGNRAPEAGGGIYGGGYERTAGITLERTIVTDNWSALASAIYIDGPMPIVVRESVIKDNNGGGLRGAGSMTIERSEVWDSELGSTDVIESLVSDSTFGSLNAVDSTLEDSPFSRQGRIHRSTLVGDYVICQETRMFNSTVSGRLQLGDPDQRYCIGNGLLINTTVHGDILALRGGMNISRSIVDGACIGDLPRLGGNIESPGDTCGFDKDTSQVNVSADDLKLGELADNGGPTETHALGEGSVAIDVIPAEGCLGFDGDPLTTDQRGEPRDDGMCDVGAFEVQP